MASNNRLKTGSGLGSGSGLSQINYKFTCRCCLKSDAEFLKLDTLAVARNLDPNEADKIPLLRCLLFCIRAENSPELPQYICVECSKSLQIAYYFLQNALRAHEILCRKLCPGKARPTVAQRFNGSIKQPEVALRQAGEDNRKPQKAFRHECKLCGFVVYNRMELKQHIRQHVDGSSYSCKVCSFVTLKQRLLQEHYSATHGISANQADEQVKPKSTFYSDAPSTSSAAVAAALDEEIKVCTLEDMELLIPTVLTPGDYLQPTIDEEQLRDLEQQLAASMGEPVAAGADALTTNLTQMKGKKMSIGSEYVVMPDGTLQIKGGGVVIEYIDDSRPNSNATGNLSLQNLLGGGTENEPMEIDVSELIVEEMVPQIKAKPKPIPIGPAPLKYKCKDCPKAFSTMGRLKSHQISHSHLPKFYCDQCPFFTLRSPELCLHYKTKHIKNEEAGYELQTYSCDMCLFEARTSNHLRVHYTDKHMIQPSEVQLRPSWTSDSATAGAAISSARTSGQGSNEQGTQLQHTEIPLGIQYPPAALAAAATVANQLMLQHQQQQDQQQQDQQQQQQQDQLPAIATQTSTITESGDINVVVDATPLFYAATVAGTGTGAAVEGQGQGQEQEQGDPGTIAAEAMANGDTYEIFPEISTSGLTATQPVPALSTTTTTSANISMFGDMQDFIDNADVAAICTIPADDMPVVDGDDIVIDNNNISLDFDAENLFEDFEDEDEAVGGEEEDEDDEDEDAENEDENDNNDAATDQNLLLTSDDDDVDDFDDEQSKHLQKPYCIFCNKKFTSQYKFENHMFVHRGLAPYRCELCTNLYNMKRLLIRHYKTVHKRMPTRDMVQAKGDKVLVARTNIETIQLDMDRDPMLMCAKCPFECELDTEMRKHLNAHHGINDGVSVHANEVFIIRKLPFECPRCIRSFAAKSTLTRHLQRSHLVDTIIEMQSNQTTTSSAATTTSTTCTATTSMPANTPDDIGNKGQHQQQLEMASTAASGTNTVGYGDGECEVAVKPEGAGFKEEPTTTSGTSASASASSSIRSTIKAESASQRIPNPPDESSEPRTMNSLDHVLAKGEPASAPHTAIPPASSSSSTPTPFDFDFDLMGDAGNSRLTPTTPSTSNKQIDPTTLPYTSNPSTSTPCTNTNAFAPSPLLNGSDKLLTAAMEPSPIKGLRPRMPRNNIYVCKLCKKSFDELGKLVKHEMDAHSIGESARLGYEHRCGTCGTTYRTMALLKFHMKRHLNRKFSCKLCVKDFVHKTELDRHMLAKHATEKSFRCSLDGCRKMFAFKHHLVRHQNASHLKMRHVCSICQKEMKTSLHLRHHMTVHRGLTAYKCPKCDRTYLRRGALRVHALTVHHVQLTEAELAEIFRNNVGYTNPHDMKVITRNGQLVRRKELEAEREKELQMGDEPSVAVANISK